MARYPLTSFRFSVFLPTGTLVTRIHCPECGCLHYDIQETEECLCYGCGRFLSVSGLELRAAEVPNSWYENEEYNTGEDPDYPSFWQNLEN
ncbi:MAG: hypothetical protein JSV41_14070 [Gemmatimonadota bacterium]|nr:MAG: hypothetical protein JSV41_14070 [Gemmatimonadota bacterium]